MTHKQASVYAAWVSIQWRSVDGRKQASPDVIMAALQRAYDLGAKGGFSEGYSAGREDAARAVTEMVGEHELVLEEGNTRQW
jgi:hypothetical protein